VLWENHTEATPKVTSVESNFSNTKRAKLYDLVSRYRIDNGLQPLSIDYSLEKAAEDKANDMVVRNYWDHNTPDGAGPWVFISKYNYRYYRAGENLARDYSSAEDILAGWIKSPSHNKNLIEEDFEDTGIGYKQNIVVMFYGEQR